VRTFGSRESGGLEFLELPERHRLIELDVPAALEGLTVAEAAPRARFGIAVLAVNRMGRDGVERRFVPGPADRFEHGDVLVVMGTEEAIAKLQDARGAPVTAG
jgi:trk system potassium uptake protein TrkA